ncbi:hypothetical protein K504DRAFT_460509 [Pleomassaria siparia CBS 279.74]|uniref:SPT2-domain-containing protein n=1 Tax=Pleomassaria siparia CBS 279.74 TaxID=1314801 RepID=A0A6G1JXB2_9PLEO|nr:hypothetical protein K504DRAFT_460509 [Pleomassaria siparia CBS 279.74]
MNLLNNILSSIDPSAATQFSAQTSRQTQVNNAPRPVQRPTLGASGTPQAQPLKRKAEGQPDGGEAKIQRKDAPTQSSRVVLPTRAATTPGMTKPKAAASASAVPYRGTAGTGGVSTARFGNTVAKKPPSPVARASSAFTKPAASTPPSKVTTTATTTTTLTAASASTKKLGYAALLQKAAQTQQAKPTAPPLKHEAPVILKKKDRLALKAQEKAISKGKKPTLIGAGVSAGKATDFRGDLNKERRKPAELGYQGTAQPAKKPVEIGYKGTARPMTTPTAVAGKGRGQPAQKGRPKVGQAQYGGYARWSDEDEEDLDEEDYDSAGSSDMEGDAWDLEREELESAKIAKKEDLEEQKRENAAKQAKAERKKKMEELAAKAASQKRRY